MDGKEKTRLRGCTGLHSVLSQMYVLPGTSEWDLIWLFGDRVIADVIS